MKSNSPRTTDWKGADDLQATGWPPKGSLGSADLRSNVQNSEAVIGSTQSLFAANWSAKDGPARRRTVLAIAAVAFVGSTGYYLVDSELRGHLWNATTGSLLALMAFGIFRFRRAKATPWVLVWCGLGLAYGGGLLMSYGSSIGFEPGSPSIVDAMRLLNYPLAACGGLIFLARHDPRSGLRATLETIIVTVSGATLIWFYVGLPMTGRPNLSVMQTLVSGAYPMGNILLMGVIASVLVRTTSRPGSLILLTLGLAGNLIADIFFGIQTLNGTYQPGGLTDLGWLFCFAGLAMAPSWADPDRGASFRELLTVERGNLTSGRVVVLGVSLVAGPVVIADQTAQLAGWRELFVVFGSILIIGLVVYRLGLHNIDLQRTEAELRIANEQIEESNDALRASQLERQTLLWRLNRVVEEERTRIAADIHDRPLQELAAVGYQLERISMALVRGDLESAETITDAAADNLTKQLEALRMIMTEIRPPVLDERGLHGALVGMIHRFMEEHPELTVRVEGSEDKLEQEVETVFYRVAQEALNNVAHHAHATEVVLRTEADEHDARLIVVDDGRGFDTSTMSSLVTEGHYGLAGMRERVVMLDGSMQVESHEQGTTLTFQVPIGETSRQPISGTKEPISGQAATIGA